MHVPAHYAVGDTVPHFEPGDRFNFKYNPSGERNESIGVNKGPRERVRGDSCGLVLLGISDPK
jgi:hypothetical protein